MYNKLKEANKEFDIIYVSFDESRQDWKGYSALMPWISLQYKDACTEDLIQLFQVSGIKVCLNIFGYYYYIVCRNPTTDFVE